MMPRFLRSPDPRRDDDYPRRARLAYDSIIRWQSADQPLLEDNGYGPEPLTVELACEWAEARARAELL